MSTVSSLLIKLRYLLEEDTQASGGFFDDDRLVEFMDEGQRVLVSMLDPSVFIGTTLHTSSTLVHAANTDSYPLPSTLAKLHRVTRDHAETEGADTEIPVYLMKQGEWGAHKKNPFYLPTIDHPVGYVWGTSVVVQPAPPNTSATRGVKVWYVKIPTTLTSSSSVEIPEITEGILLKWAAHLATLREGLMDDSQRLLDAAIGQINYLNGLHRDM